DDHGVTVVLVHQSTRKYAYSGRSFVQLDHWIFRANDRADGELDLSGRRIRLADVRVPVLSIAGRDDGIAPRAAVHHVARLVRNVELATVPGGHLGSLTGRAARTSTWPLLDSFLRRASRI